jgi:hypothetical protein
LGIVLIFVIATIINYLHKKHKQQEEEGILGDDAKAKSSKKLTGTIQNENLGESLISEQY